MRAYKKNKSRLLNGIEKVIDRQNAKPAFNEVDFGMNTIVRYKNIKHVDKGNLSDFYFPLTWQPLKYVIRKIPHTIYTYALSNNQIKEGKVKKLSRLKTS